MPNDMLVKLYNINDDLENSLKLHDNGIHVKQVLSVDRQRVIEFVKSNFSNNWVNESENSFSNSPISCFVAVKDKKIIGFACYHATTKDYFGPTGVLDEYRGKGVGKALLLKCMLAMKEEGYAYAIIGCVGDAIKFYERTVSATVIEDSFPGIYGRLVSIE